MSALRSSSEFRRWSMAVCRCGVGTMCSLSSMVSFVPFGLSIRAGLSEKWHSDSLCRCTQIVQGCSPLHFCFLRLQLSHARLHRRRAPGVVLARGMVLALVFRFLRLRLRCEAPSETHLWMGSFGVNGGICDWPACASRATGTGRGMGRTFLICRT